MPAPEKIDAYGPYLGIPVHPLKCQATYIWIDGTGENLRSKTRVLDSLPTSIDEYPIWNYDGSSTGQATGRKSDLTLKPVADYPDPFLGGNNRLVLCETFDPENNPTKTNHRYYCKQIMDAVKIKIFIHLVGQKMVILLLKVLTIVVLELIKCLVVKLFKLMQMHVY